MLGFITRIELHNNATFQDYENLHRNMNLSGFSKSIVADNGLSYLLPSAEYFSKIGTLESNLESAKNAAGKIGKPYAVFIAQMSGWSAVGLSLGR